MILPENYTNKPDKRARRRGMRRAGTEFPRGPSVGDVFFETDTNIMWVWNGTAWQTVSSTGGGGITDHGALTGLADDDHPQYQKESEKNQPNGYAGLDGSGVLSVTLIPGSIATDAEVTAAIATHAATPHGGSHPDLAAHDTLGLATQAELDAHAGAADPHAGYQKESEKGASSGYAGLNSAAVVVPGQVAAGTMDGSGVFVRGTDTGTQTWSPILDSDIPATIARDSEVATSVANHAGAADPHTIYQKESEKGAANGYAGLGANSIVPTAQLGTGTANSTTYLRGDQTWATVISGHTHDGTGGATSLIIGGTSEGGAAIPVASSVGSIAIGDYANAGTGTQPIAIGTGANATAAPSATGQGSIAIGASNSTTVNGPRASATGAIAIGSGTANSTEIGALASGIQSLAIGPIASATTNRAIAIGAWAAATNGTTIAIGAGSNATSGPQASSAGGIAIGAGQGTSIAGARAGLNSVAIGNGDTSNAAASATSARAIAVGLTASAGGIQTIALGSFALAGSSNGCIAIGGGSNAAMAASATGTTSIAIGGSDSTSLNGARATGTQSIAIGGGSGSIKGPLASGNGAIAIGNDADALATDAVAIGRNSHALLASGTALGTFARAEDLNTVAIGISAWAYYPDSIAIGNFPETYGAGSIAIGTLSETGSGATGAIAIGEGAQSWTAHTVSVGGYSESTGIAAIAIGGGVNSTSGPLANGQGAISIGGANGAVGSRASGVCSIAIGSGEVTVPGAKASASYSIAIGASTEATAMYSVALGNSAVASHSGSMAIGQYAETTATDQIMLGSYQQVYIPGPLKIPTGAAPGYVLTSDAAGLATWQVSAGGGGGSDTPVGAIMAYYGTVAPTGWLLCDGSAIPGGYTQLIAQVGPNTPNFKGRTLVGLDATQTEFDTLGELGGAKTHTLTEGEIPFHSHRYGNAWVNDMAPGSSGNRFHVAVGVWADQGFNTIGTGGGQPHNNLQPYATINWIIKAAPASGGSGGSSDIEPIVWMGGF